jgi:hypothetical protein
MKRLDYYIGFLKKRHKSAKIAENSYHNIDPAAITVPISYKVNSSAP